MRLGASQGGATSKSVLYSRLQLQILVHSQGNAAPRGYSGSCLGTLFFAVDYIFEDESSRWETLHPGTTRGSATSGNVFSVVGTFEVLSRRREKLRPGATRGVAA